MIQILDYYLNSNIVKLIFNFLTFGTVVLAYLSFFFKVQSIDQLKLLISRFKFSFSGIGVFAKIRISKKFLKSFLKFTASLAVFILIIWGAKYGYNTITKIVEKNNTLEIGIISPPYGEISTSFLQGVNLAIRESNENRGINDRRLKLTIFNSFHQSISSFEADLLKNIQSNSNLIGIINGYDIHSSILIDQVFPKTLQIVANSHYPYDERTSSNSIWLKKSNKHVLNKLLLSANKIIRNPLIITVGSNSQFDDNLLKGFESYEIINPEMPSKENFEIIFNKYFTNNFDGILFLSLYPFYYEIIDEQLKFQRIMAPVFVNFPLSISYKEIYYMQNDFYCTGLNEFLFDNSFSKAKNQFVEKFKNEFFLKPSYFSALGYDAANILLNGIKKSKSINPKEIRKEIINTSFFQGATGSISINSEGINTVNDDKVYKIKDGRVSILEE